MENKESKIKREVTIREFRKQVSGKPQYVLQNLDTAFFKVENFVSRQKPHDVKFHITKGNDLVFNVVFNSENETGAYIEHFFDGDTQMTLSSGDEIPEMTQGTLTQCLDSLEQFLTTKKYGSNCANS
jgi:hypothetical protein